MAGPIDHGLAPPPSLTPRHGEDVSLERSSLPSSSRDALLQEQQEVLIAGLPGSQFIQNQLQRGEEALRRVGNQTVNLINDARDTPAGRLLEGGVRSLVNTTEDVINVLRNPGDSARVLWDMTTENAAQIPGALQQLVTRPRETIGDAWVGAQQTLNDSALYYLSNGFPGMPPTMAEHGRIEFTPEHGFVIRDPITGVVADFGGDNPARIGFRGYRLEVSPGVFTQPVPGTVTTYDSRPAVSIENGDFLFTSEGWRVREPSGQYGPAYANAVRADLTDPRTQERVTGLVVSPQEASDGQVFIMADGDFRVQSSLRDGQYSATFSQDYQVAVLDGQVWVQERLENGERGALFNVNPNNDGVVRLPNAEGGYGPPRTGRYVMNNIDGVEVPGVLRSDLDGFVVELPGGSYRVQLPNQGLSQPISGTPARLTDPATGQQGVGIISTNEFGDRVFVGTRGIQVSEAGSDRFSPAVAQGTPQYIQNADGSRDLVVVLDGDGVRPELRGRAAATADGFRLADEQGNWSGPIPGVPTVLDGQPVIEVRVDVPPGVEREEGAPQDYRVVTDGRTARVSDATGRGWTSSREGSVVQLSDGSLGIQPPDREDVLITPTTDSVEQIRLYDPETDTWSNPVSGQLQELHGEPVVRSGDYVFNARNEFLDTSDPSSEWTLLESHYPPQELRAAEPESLWDRFRRGVADGTTSQATLESIVGGPSVGNTQLYLATHGIQNPETLGDYAQNLGHDLAQFGTRVVRTPLIPYTGNIFDATIGPTLMGQRHVEGTFGTTAEEMREAGRNALLFEVATDLAFGAILPAGTGSVLDSPVTVRGPSSADVPASTTGRAPGSQVGIDDALRPITGADTALSPSVSSARPELRVVEEITPSTSSTSEPILRVEEAPIPSNNVTPLHPRSGRPHLQPVETGTRFSVIDGGNTAPPSATPRPSSSTPRVSPENGPVSFDAARSRLRSDVPEAPISPAASAQPDTPVADFTVGRAETLQPYQYGTAAEVPDILPNSPGAASVHELRPPPPPSEVSPRNPGEPTVPSEPRGPQPAVPDPAVPGGVAVDSPPLQVGEDFPTTISPGRIILPSTDPNRNPAEHQEYLERMRIRPEPLDPNTIVANLDPGASAETVAPSRDAPNQEGDTPPSETPPSQRVSAEQGAPPEATSPSVSSDPAATEVLEATPRERRSPAPRPPATLFSSEPLTDQQAFRLMMYNGMHPESRYKEQIVDRIGEWLSQREANRLEVEPSTVQFTRTQIEDHLSNWYRQTLEQVSRPLQNAPQDAQPARRAQQRQLTQEQVEQEVGEALDTALTGVRIDTATQHTLSEHGVPRFSGARDWNPQQLPLADPTTTFIQYDLEGVSRFLEREGFSQEAANTALSLGYMVRHFLPDASDLAFQDGGDGILTAAFEPEASDRWERGVRGLATILEQLSVQTDNYEIIPGLQGTPLRLHTLIATQEQLGNSVRIGGVDNMYGETNLYMDSPLWNALELGMKRGDRAIGRDQRILTTTEIVNLTARRGEPLTPHEVELFTPHLTSDDQRLLSQYNFLSSEDPSSGIREREEFETIRSQVETALRRAGLAHDQQLINDLLGEPGTNPIVTDSGLVIPRNGIPFLGFETRQVEGVTATTVIISTDNLAGNSPHATGDERFEDGLDTVYGVNQILGSEGQVIIDWFGEPSAFGKYSVLRLHDVEARGPVELTSQIYEYANRTGAPLHTGMIDTPGQLTVVTIPDPNGGEPIAIQVLAGDSLTAFGAAFDYKRSRQSYNQRDAELNNALSPDPWLDEESPIRQQQELEYERRERMIRRRELQLRSEDDALLLVDPSIQDMIEAGREFQRQQRGNRPR